MPGDGAGDWASEAADRLEELVLKIRSQTTDRLVKIARLLVFGLLAAITGTMAALLVVIALIRAVNELLPGGVWVTYLLLGAIFTGAGLFFWSRKDRVPGTRSEA